MHLLFTTLLLIPLTAGCDGEGSKAETEECFSHDDCPEGQICVISHDHEGDDHDHGGACEDEQTDAGADDTGPEA